MQPNGQTPDRTLARRLRQLRKQHWPDLVVTQKQIAEALGGERPLSLALISSWESEKVPVIPPAHRLAAYARFFATRRSVASDPARLLLDDELVESERRTRAELHRELMSALNGIEPGGPTTASVLATLSEGGAAILGPSDVIGGGTYFFGEDARRIVIVHPGLSDAGRDELEALIEMFGHVRAVNPLAEVSYLTPESLGSDDYASHLILLGTVAGNPIIRDISYQLGLPIRQESHPDPKESYFETEGQRFLASFEANDRTSTLREDVAYFARGVNPMNRRRTVTLCNGLTGSGTYGAVRALTDRAFRRRNEEYLVQRFGGALTFGMLFRVAVLAGHALTPDWTVRETPFFDFSQGE